jgi:hypothetical protein
LFNPHQVTHGGLQKAPASHSQISIARAAPSFLGLEKNVAYLEISFLFSKKNKKESNFH